MLEFLTGSGLAAAAGMNASIPMLVVGLANRFFPDAMALPEGWAWISNGWVLGIIAVLLVVEIVADKIPAVDSVNDVIQTIVVPILVLLALALLGLLAWSIWRTARTRRNEDLRPTTDRMTPS